MPLSGIPNVIIAIIIIIIQLTWCWATCWPYPVSHSQKSHSWFPWFLLPVGLQSFSILGNLLQGIQFTCCNQFLLYSWILFKTGVTFSSFAISVCSKICPSESQCAITKYTWTHVQPAQLPTFYFQSYTTCSLRFCVIVTRLVNDASSHHHRNVTLNICFTYNSINCLKMATYNYKMQEYQ